MVTGDLSPQAGLLGSLLIDDRLVPQALARVREEDFLSPVYRDVFRAIRRCYADGTPVDPVTVLTAMGGGEELRGLLMQLMELTPTAAHWEAYARDARREARKARARDLAGQILESPGLEEIQGLIGQLNGLLVDRAGVERSTMEEGLLAFMARQEHPKRYIPTGLPKLDRHLYADFGDLVVLGGYPSAGKTALPSSSPTARRRPCGWGFTAWRPAGPSSWTAWWPARPGSSWGASSAGTLSEQQWQMVAGSGRELRSRGLELVEASGMTVQDIQADALAHRYEAVYVDYLQLVEPETRKATRTEQVLYVYLLPPASGPPARHSGRGPLPALPGGEGEVQGRGSGWWSHHGGSAGERPDRAGRRRRPAPVPGGPRPPGQEPPGAQAGQEQGRRAGPDVSGLRRAVPALPGAGGRGERPAARPVEPRRRGGAGLKVEDGVLSVDTANAVEALAAI